MAEAQALLEKGLSPYQISKQLGIPWSKALTDLYTRVRDGYLRRSDIVFSIALEKRDAINAVLKLHTLPVMQIVQILKSTEPAHLWSSSEEMLADATVVHDFRFVRERSQLTFLGEMYGDLCDIEVRLFEFTLARLQSEFGEDETGWWVNSVPAQIRQTCATRQEQDRLEYPRHAYLDLIDLKEILDRNWRLFEPHFAKVDPGPMLKNRLLTDMQALNSIRNKVMHPLRKAVLSEKDFELVRDFAKKIRILTGGQATRWIV